MVINTATYPVGCTLPHKQMRRLIIAFLGICRSCHVRKQEITIEMILFEYSRHQTPSAPTRHCSHINIRIYHPSVQASKPLWSLVQHRKIYLPTPHWFRTACPSKNSTIRIDAPLSRQPLVKGERLVRSEVSAAMKIICVFSHREIALALPQLP